MSDDTNVHFQQHCETSENHDCSGFQGQAAHRRPWNWRLVPISGPLTSQIGMVISKELFAAHA